MTPHEFQGRSDRPCEVCRLPDRDPIHATGQTVWVNEPAALRECPGCQLIDDVSPGPCRRCGWMDGPAAQDPSTTGTVLGEEARRALIDAQLSCKRFLGEDGYTSVAVQANDEAADEALAVLAPHVAALLSAAREEEAEAERERCAVLLEDMAADASEDHESVWHYKAGLHAGSAAIRGSS